MIIANRISSDNFLSLPPDGIESVTLRIWSLTMRKEWCHIEVTSSSIRRASGTKEREESVRAIPGIFVVPVEGEENQMLFLSLLIVLMPKQKEKIVLHKKPVFRTGKIEKTHLGVKLHKFK